MGFFDSLSKFASEAAARRQFELDNVGKQIEYLPLDEACIHLVRKFDSSSLSMKNSMTTVLFRRIDGTEDTRELFRAFQEMYELYQRKHNMFALNISQRIGRRLYKLDDRLVLTRDNNGKTFYYPNDSYYYF